MDQNLENKPVFDAESLTKKVIQLIALSAGKDPKKLSPDQPVFSIQGQFDSFALMELVLQIEETFNLKIPDEELDPDIFYSARTIVAYLVSRLD